ncbi:alpha/beta fold hydrolase [Alloscardovia omnicolens]|uniref:esterase/lipase family protein n=1 Tax=Alloscardovia omnicolens TaxID=419015 RepID=UPI00254C3D23|nr:alpha/beta fold hydrolase [Alloscardovia omnicolens]MDK6249288.1 alpha/beta fold hydrolase [Alloscardovia omnicolens]
MSSPIYTFAHIFGGTTVLDNPDELHTYACQMINYAEQLEMNTSAMQQTHSYIHQRSMTIATCAAHSGASHPSSAHCANLCTVLAQHVQSALSVIAQLRHIADCMMRSYNLYSQTEAQTSRIISALTMAAAYHYPVPTAFALGAWSTIREMTSPHASLIGALTNSRSAQEDYLSGVSRIFSPCEGIPGVADALAHPVSPLSSTHTSYAMNIKAVSVSAPLPAAHNLHDTIVNLEKLSIGQPGNSYGTVAIQRYTHTDGSHSWIVTIPGTDGKKDSPFGWSQNLSLMSSREQTREQAHSLLAVRTAMHRAGIKAGEPVALVGHSQGGIVAAALASDAQQPYTIAHVVTAGSPIAHHPIATKTTWVTSIETDREIVSHLDGRSNPKHPHWLTVRGIISDSASGLANNATAPNPAPAHSTFPSPTPVAHAAEKHELTHGMNYHRATLEDAQKLHNENLNEHDQHIRTLTEGTMDKNMYFRCRISSN